MIRREEKRGLGVENGEVVRLNGLEKGGRCSSRLERWNFERKAGWGGTGSGYCGGFWSLALIS